MSIMTDTEEKKETPPASEEEKGDETEEKDTSTEDSGKESSDSDSEDSTESDKDEGEHSQDAEYWKKIAQTEQTAKEKAESALAQKRFKKSEAKRQGEEVEEEAEDEDEEEKPLTRAEFDAALRKERASIEQTVLAGETLRIARGLSASNEEAAAIVAIYNGRVFPEYLTHEQKVTEAFYLAQGPRLTGKILELRRSLQSKNTKKQSGSENVHRDAPKGNFPKMSAQDRNLLQSSGFSWDGNRFVKKLPGGKILVKTSLKDKPQILKG